MSSTTPALFQPIRVGDMKLAHRVVLAPMTRLRASAAHVHTDLGIEYYAQRASVPGTLLISEGTFIAAPAGGMPHVPGIWSDDQIAAWKEITDAVHAKGSYIFLQIAALGRSARPAQLKQENPDYPHVAPSPIALSTSPEDVPRELTKAEIKEYIGWFATAASNAVHRAGFDGIEIHGANGFFVDQFLQDMSNKRTDEYGGSVENRSRFGLELLDAVTAAVGQSKAAIRLSPWNTSQEMRMEDPVPQFSYFVQKIKEKYPQLAYLHVASPDGPDNRGPEDESQVHFIHKIWAPRPTITTGGYDRESGIRVAEETGQLVGYGKSFLANPDLPFRLRENLPLEEPQLDTFYLPMSEKGYTTYPFHEEFLKSSS
ncbi:NADH:flavin oxidoreductase/NADH oxidase [Daedaleopsis nitida]|nr:NADH:flavin oxidoreductase/NADH oxidase [Daedaleopsis nitida]